jgi:tRNA pseudouridine38-40 synthase
LVRFGYDGSGLGGWARQPGVRTVEGVLLGGLRRFGGPMASRPLRLEVASRTDRGVSARNNVLALSWELDGTRLLRALNGVSPEVCATAASPAPEGFRLRHARRRIYRYFEPGPDRDFDTWKTAAKILEGVIDVRSFGRGLPSHEPVWRTIESIRVDPRPGGAVVEVRAPSFVWGEVRKLIGALREFDAGRLSPERLRSAAEGTLRLPLPMAEPEGLVLWEVEYPLRWEVFWEGPNRRQRARSSRVHGALWTRRQVLRALARDPNERARAVSAGPAGAS